MVFQYTPLSLPCRFLRHPVYAPSDIVLSWKVTWALFHLHYQFLFKNFYTDSYGITSTPVCWFEENALQSSFNVNLSSTKEQHFWTAACNSSKMVPDNSNVLWHCFAANDLPNIVFAITSVPRIGRLLLNNYRNKDDITGESIENVPCAASYLVLKIYPLHSVSWNWFMICIQYETLGCLLFSLYMAL